MRIEDERIAYDKLVVPWHKIGNTKCPKWAKPKPVKVKICGYNEKLSTEVYNHMFTKVEKILVDGKEVPHIGLEDGVYSYEEYVFSDWTDYPYPYWGDDAGDFYDRDSELDRAIEELQLKEQNRFDPSEIRRFLILNGMELQNIKQIVIEDLEKSILTVHLKDGTVKKINH